MCSAPAKRGTTSKAATHGRLQQARKSVCVAAILAYMNLSYRGAKHCYEFWMRGSCNESDLLADFVMMLGLYSCEVAGAVIFGVTTLYRWSRRHFLEHHLPLVIVSAFLISQNELTGGRATFQHREWMAVVLLISCNEAAAALLSVWPNAFLERYRNLPTFLVLCLMLVFELNSWFRATATQFHARDPAMWISTALSQFLLLAAAVHIAYIRSVTKAFTRKLWTSPSTKGS